MPLRLFANLLDGNESGVKMNVDFFPEFQKQYITKVDLTFLKNLYKNEFGIEITKTNC